MSQVATEPASLHCRSASVDRWWPWAGGLVLAVVVVGPGLAPGSLLSLDLLVTPHIPIPNGLFGLGPALSQRVPSFAVVGLASLLVGGPVAAKAAIVAMIAAGFAGAVRLTGRTAPIAAQVAAGVFWAAGPFALTRIGVGHLNVTWAIATLPWALPRLCRPSAAPWSTFLAAGLLAFGGPASGTLGAAVVVIALVVEADRRPLPVVAAVAAANLVWVLPTAVLLWAGAGVTGSGGFATSASGVSGWLAVLAGNGFWRADFQTGAVGWIGAVVGVVLTGLALFGRRDLDRRWARPATVVAVVGLVLAVASTVPVAREGYRWLSDLPVGAPLRESQRFLALWLLVVAPAAALGAVALARRLVEVRPDVGVRLAPLATVLPLALVVAVSVPGWWGIEGRLHPVEFPSGWSPVRIAVNQAPGPTVAFPWSEYPHLSFAAGRSVFNPVPDYLGGDVISSFDPRFDPSRPSQEQVDRRAEVAGEISDHVLAGQPAATDLAALGVRWVVVVHEDDWRDYRALNADPGLRRAVHNDDADLYEVIAWRGRATDRGGASHRLDRPVPPVLLTDAPPGSVLDVAGAPGWIQGWSTPVPVTVDGRLQLTGGSGFVWFWPALALVTVDAGLVAATVVAVRRRRGHLTLGEKLPMEHLPLP